MSCSCWEADNFFVRDCFNEVTRLKWRLEAPWQGFQSAITWKYKCEAKTNARLFFYASETVVAWCRKAFKTRQNIHVWIFLQHHTCIKRNYKHFNNKLGFVGPFIYNLVLCNNLFLWNEHASRHSLFRLDSLSDFRVIRCALTRIPSHWCWKSDWNTVGTDKEISLSRRCSYCTHRCKKCVTTDKKLKLSELCLTGNASLYEHRALQQPRSAPPDSSSRRPIREASLVRPTHHSTKGRRNPAPLTWRTGDS